MPPDLNEALEEEDGEDGKDLKSSRDTNRPISREAASKVAQTKKLLHLLNLGPSVAEFKPRFTAAADAARFQLASGT